MSMHSLTVKFQIEYSNYLLTCEITKAMGLALRCLVNVYPGVLNLVFNIVDKGTFKCHTQRNKSYQLT